VLRESTEQLGVGTQYVARCLFHMNVVSRGNMQRLFKIQTPKSGCSIPWVHVSPGAHHKT